MKTEMDRHFSWLDRLVILAIILTGLSFLGGGAYLLYLDGSSYYVISGAVFLIAGAMLWRRRLLGAWLFGGAYVFSLVWTVFEAGTRIWAWVPRMGFLTLLAFFVCLMLPKLLNREEQLGNRSGLSKGLAVICVICAGIAFGIAWLPQNTYLSTTPSPSTPLVAIPSDAVRADQADSDWAAYGRDKDATRYSPLQQIDTQNVKNLKVAWTYRTGDLPPPGKINKWAAETTPIKLGDGVYICTATNNLAKLDPTTGKALWTFDAGTQYQSVPYTAACRGVTYFKSTVSPAGSSCHERIIEATLDMRLIAVDAQNGKLCQGFGENGQVNLLKGLGETVPGFVAVTSPPPIINGVIAVNHQVLDGQKRWAPSGVIRGYDAEDGRFRWAWDVNRPGQHNEPGPGEEYSRGTPNSWAAMTGDDKLGCQRQLKTDPLSY